MPEQRLPKLNMEWIPIERKKKGRPKKTWMEDVQEAMIVRGLEADQMMDREEWRLVSGRQRKCHDTGEYIYMYIYRGF